MPPRRKPTSTRQKKADIKLKRAIKRGDVPPPDPKTKTRRPKLKRGPTGNLIGSAADPANVATIHAARRLQSDFVTLPSDFLEDTKHLASTLSLERPISNEVAVLSDIYSHKEDQSASRLVCPSRPKWTFDMTKKQVERNEEGLFKKWLEQMDSLVGAWQNRDGVDEDVQKDAQPRKEHDVVKELRMMPKSPTYFERNLEVWRQLWRVTEISQILLVLLDSRCPLLHFPPSLSVYLSNHKVILVLTKVDISGPERVSAWEEYFHQKYPLMRVVQVESYVVKEESAGHQGRTLYAPHLPQSFRERLVVAIREAHAEMLLPPEKIRDNPDRLKYWKPSVKCDIDWEGVLNARSSKVGTTVGGSAIPLSGKTDDGDDGKEPREEKFERKEPTFLTIGLIGQPNVGKSSLLNALFGMNKVRASKTPGKTLFWTSDVRLVDCPGLVMPNFVPMEMQVLSGILPISRVSAVPSCIHYASERIPIEEVYKLAHPSTSSPLVPDKRTWREGMKAESSENKPLVWTAMDVLTAYANMKKWVTAKAGRPDIHRAGNARAGLWMPHATSLEEESETESEEEDLASSEHDTLSSEDDESANFDENSIIGEAVGVASGFLALAIDHVEEEEEEEDRI
ncbi:hypothetical protein H0H81_012442 [Sphagnurus paluster]|uniref:Guanine nucleotide-binding protein-like 1 n=1 Tax=Sphagnurus paluster TaxID=117069 RepID=A0A9P7K3N3_9AGAR|nr:hypothetical protein H0H81_012442 [Sphagnurus paluster]